MIKAAVVALVLMMSGCSTITRGTNELFAIETDPIGAMVTLSSGLSCRTPCSLRVKRRPPFNIIIEKEGFEIVRTMINSSIQGGGSIAMAGNLVLGGLIGAAVDAGTGAMYGHKPNPLTVKLIPLK